MIDRLVNGEAWSLVATPREWQRMALEVWADGMRGIVRVVTGGGKTTFALMCMMYFRRKFPTGRIVVLVPTQALLDQWLVSLEEDLNVPKDEIASYSGTSKDSDPKPVCLLILNTARQRAESLSLGQPTMLVVDECHRAGSPENAKSLKGAYVSALGLSATPEREGDDGFELNLVPILGPVVFRYDYVDAKRDGVISDFRLQNIRVSFLDDELESFNRLSRSIAVESAKLRRGSGSEAKLERLLRRRAAVTATATMRIPVAAKLAEENKGSRTIVFHERVAAAETLLRILRQRGLSATIYHGRIAPPLRRDNLRLYRRGVFDVLVCCRALDEGLNVPDTSVAIIASSTASSRQRIQRLGRVLRPAKGKSEATIVTLYVTDLEEKRLAQESKELLGTCDISWARAGL